MLRGSTSMHLAREWGKIIMEKNDGFAWVKGADGRFVSDFPVPDAAGKNLQAQYERWQPRAKYKMHLDPTVEDVKKLCSTCRKAAKV